jgi:excisionase family DNA binding protein
MEKMLEKMPQAKAPLLISKREAGALLGVCLRTIDYWISRKELPCRRFGKRILIPYTALQSFAKRDHLGVGSAAPQKEAQPPEQRQ